MLKRLTKILQKSQSYNIQPRVIEAFSQQNIVINQEVIKFRNRALQKIADLKLQLKKKKKSVRGSDSKLNEVRQIKKQILNLTRESMTGGTNQGNLDLNILARLNKDIQKQILTIYFYLLKSGSGVVVATAQKNNQLLPSVFQGIPKFSKLVNIELAQNIIDVVREYLYNQCFNQSSDNFNQKNQQQKSAASNENSLSNESNFKNILSALNCAVRIEQQIGDAIGIEQNKSLIKVLYKLMSCFLWAPRIIDSNSIVTIIKCLQSIFLKKRAYNYKTICAVVKKLAIICTAVGTNNAIIASFLFMIRLLINKYPQISMNMLDVSQFYAEQNVEDPYSLDEQQDPDLSKAESSVIFYELLLVKQKLIRQNQIFNKISRKVKQESIKITRSNCVLTFKILQSIIDLSSQLPKQILGLSPDKLYQKLNSAEDFDNIILQLNL